MFLVSPYCDVLWPKEKLQDVMLNKELDTTFFCNQIANNNNNKDFVNNSGVLILNNCKINSILNCLCITTPNYK